jgi:hypothetical protein
MNWSQIVGVLVALWGAGILISFLFRGASVGGGAYGAGQLIALIVGVLMLGAGIHRVVKGGGPKGE